MWYDSQRDAEQLRSVGGLPAVGLVKKKAVVLLQKLS